MEVFKSRCIKRLNEWNAPLSDWKCIHTYDVKDEWEDVGLFTCELCDCPQVRYVHVMHHRDYFENISVGCICAGIMEGDILAAKEREREMKNRSKRKANYMKREWQWRANGNRTMKYKNRWLTIITSRFSDGVIVLFVTAGASGTIRGSESRINWRQSMRRSTSLTRL